MQNLQNIQSLTGTSSKSSPVSLASYIESLSGLVAYYPLNETSGDAINQAPATIGTMNGTVSGATQGQAGQSGLAYSFDGVNDAVTVLDNNSLDLTTGFSLFAIVNPVSFGENNLGRIISKWVTNSGYGLTTNATNSVLVMIKDAATSTNSNNNAVTTGSWQLLGAAYTGSNINYFKNNTGVGTPASTQNATSNANDLIIGNSSTGDRTWNGLIQHVGIVNGVMTQEQFTRIAQLAGLS